MTSPYEVEILPSTLMCESCKGIGTLGGSIYIVESCTVCGGTGMIQREVMEDE